MSFWDLSSGEDVADVGNKFESGGGTMEPIPNGTTALAIIDEAKWDHDQEGNQFLSLRWSVLNPSEYKNRKIFQKLWVTDDKPNQKEPEKYRDKQKKMFFAVDANCGGKLGKSNKTPTDEVLSSSLCNKPMMIKIMVWEAEKKDGTTGRGNWIAAVAPRGNGAAAAATRKAETEDDDTPF
jgi:hypothetical protein